MVLWRKWRGPRMRCFFKAPRARWNPTTSMERSLPVVLSWWWLWGSLWGVWISWLHDVRWSAVLQRHYAEGSLVAAFLCGAVCFLLDPCCHDHAGRISLTTQEWDSWSTLCCGFILAVVVEWCCAAALRSQSNRYILAVLSWVLPMWMSQFNRTNIGFFFFYFFYLWPPRAVVLYFPAITIETHTVLCGSFKRNVDKVINLFIRLVDG